MCVCVCVCVQRIWIYLTPPSRAEWDIRSNFKLSTFAFYSDFSFFNRGCVTRAEEIRLPYYLPVAE